MKVISELEELCTKCEIESYYIPQERRERTIIHYRFPVIVKKTKKRITCEIRGYTVDVTGRDMVEEQKRIVIRVKKDQQGLDKKYISLIRDTSRGNVVHFGEVAI